MQLPINIPQNPVWALVGFFIFLSLSSFPLVVSKNPDAGIICGRNLSINANVGSNVGRIMDIISTMIDASQWGYHNASIPHARIYAFSQCYTGLSQEDCSECFRRSRRRINQCLPDRTGRVYRDGCYLRYDKYDFFKESVNHRFDQIKCGSLTDNADDVVIKKEFANRVHRAITNVTNTALVNNGFAVMEERGGVDGIYAIAQCWKTVSEEGCSKCLTHAVSAIAKGCVSAKEGKALYAGCYVKYSTERFFNIRDMDVDVKEKDFRIGFVVAGWLSLFSLLLLAFFGAHLGYMKLSLIKKKEVNNNATKASAYTSKTNFKYEVLEKATDSFHVSRKLGQGGAGSVYKGIFPDGKIVAVKRLFFTNRQWADEFFNEVNLIGGIQHKNLVKLLGCSIEGPESLLVYEYVPNKSLNQVLFATNTSMILSWKQRFDIVLGIAEGLAYLHEGCAVKIIHRDIKTSNVLLDENLTPKIADFGLVRCADPERTHVSTGIAGTLGYMAPEYLVRGQLTEKADIYAFGVMILEVACGKKNTIFTQGSNSVLHSVWKNYKANHITESIDSVLKVDLPKNQASKVLQIGLLCTQARGSLRPYMSEVVQMLKNEHSVVPAPKQPPFLNSSVLNVEDSFKSSSGSLTGLYGREFSDASSFYTVESTTSFSRRTTQLKDTSRNESFDP